MLMHSREFALLATALRLGLGRSRLCHPVLLPALLPLVLLLFFMLWLVFTGRYLLPMTAWPAVPCRFYCCFCWYIPSRASACVIAMRACVHKMKVSIQMQANST